MKLSSKTCVKNIENYAAAYKYYNLSEEIDRHFDIQTKAYWL